MRTNVRIATVSQDGKFLPTAEGNVERMLSLVDRILPQKPDLVCLPEGFNDVGVGKPLSEKAEHLNGPTVEACSRLARSAGCYVVCPIHLREDGDIFNSAVILDRSGAVMGAYHKVCPVNTAPDYTVLEHGGVTPGRSLPVFDFDFGRVGIQICFDAGFPENWQALADEGVRLVLWPSAYDGGFPLRVYAYLHHYYVVSSTRTGRSRIIDPCGEILEETTDTSPVAFREINLDFAVAHWDWNMAIPDRIQAKYGDRVAIRQWDAGSAHFVVEPMDSSITTAQLQEEFGFESSAEYYNRHRAAYQRVHEGKPLLPQQARHGCRPQWSK